MSNREKIKALINQIGDIADQEGWLWDESLLLLAERMERSGQPTDAIRSLNDGRSRFCSECLEVYVP